MIIRKTEISDIGEVMNVYDRARKFMREHGNHAQWVNGYPTEELIVREIRAGHSYVCENAQGEIVGTFCFIIGPDPTYAYIEGKWLDDAPYGTIHRLGSNGREKGVAAACIEWCIKTHPNIRSDTHRDNTVMQNIFRKHGFVECGIIYTDDNTPRIAFQHLPL